MTNFLFKEDGSYLLLETGDKILLENQTTTKDILGKAYIQTSLTNQTITAKANIEINNRYWVGGSGNWSDSTNHWSDASGGSPDSTFLPTSSDNVFIDSSSGFGGGGTINVGNFGYCKNFSCTSGHTYTISGESTLNPYGSVSLESGVTITITLYLSNSENTTFNQNNATIDILTCSGSGFVTLENNLNCPNFTIDDGTFDANDFDLILESVQCWGGTLYMGSGTWEFTSSSDMLTYYGATTVYCETSTINITTTGSGSLRFGDRGSHSYNNVVVKSTSTGSLQILSTNTFNNLEIYPNCSLYFACGLTQTVSNFDAVGTSGNLITLNNKSLGIVQTHHLVNIGSGYSVGSTFRATGAGYNCRFVVNSIDGSGGITDYQFISSSDQGTSYWVGTYNTYTLSGGGSGAQVHVDSIDSSAFNLLKSSGVVDCDYLDIHNSNTLPLPVLVDSYSEINLQGSFALGSGGDGSPWGQSFTVTTGGVLNSVKVYIKRYGLADGDVTIQLYAHTGVYGTSSVWTGLALATSNPVEASTLSESYELVTFDFSGTEKITLTDSTYYCLVFNYDGEEGYINFGSDYTSPTHSGNGIAYGPEAYENMDVCFYVYKDGTGATWNAGANSVDGGGNSGWIFSGEFTTETQIIEVKTSIQKTAIQTINTKANIIKNIEYSVTAKANIENNNINNRYWVGGTGNWSDATNHWALTSNGSPGAGNLPTYLNDVFIDSSSGFGAGGEITLDGVTSRCKNFTSTSGHNYSIVYSNSDIEIYGSAVFEAGTTFDSVAESWLNLLSDDIGNTITINGASIYYLQIIGSGSWVLQDNLVIGTKFYQENGTFDANNNNVTAESFSFNANSNGESIVIMGSGTWEANGSGTPWEIVENIAEDYLVTITCETSTIKLSDTTNVTKVFAGENKIYNNLWLVGEGGETYEIHNANTFNDFKAGASTYKILFERECTTTVNTFTVSGNSENTIILDLVSAVGGGQFVLYKSSGIVECDYLDISHSITNFYLSAVLDNNNTTNTNNKLYSGSNTQIGQSFVGDGGVLNMAKFNLQKNGSPTGNVNIKIYAHTGTFGVDGVPTGSVLATSETVSASSIWNGNRTFYFSGTNKITLTNEVNYFVAIEYGDGGNSLNNIQVNESTESIQSFSGNIALFNGSWNYGDDDVLCHVYTELPSNSALWYAGLNSINNHNNTGWIFNGEFTTETQIIEVKASIQNNNIDKSITSKANIKATIEVGYTYNLDTGPDLGYGVYLGNNAGSIIREAESFIARKNKLSAIWCVVQKYINGPWADVIVSICSDSGGFPNDSTPITSVVVDIDTIVSNQPFRVDFPTHLSLTIGTKYWLVLTSDTSTILLANAYQYGTTNFEFSQKTDDFWYIGAKDDYTIRSQFYFEPLEAKASIAGAPIKRITAKGYIQLPNTQRRRIEATIYDDTFDYSLGIFGANGANIRIGHRDGASFGDCTGGFRFNNIKNTPTNKAIISAKFYGTAYFTEAFTVNLRVYGQLIENATAFADADRPSQKSPLTTTYIDWTVPTSTALVIQDSPDLKTLLEEILAQGGWVDGNSFNIILKNNGSTGNNNRNFIATESTLDGGETRAAYLEIVYGDITNQSISAKANIRPNIITSSTSISTKGRINIGHEETITSKSSIEKSRIETITTKSRIEISSIESLNANGNIKNIFIKTLTSKGRITLTNNQTISSKASIYVKETKNIDSKGRITQNISYDILALGRISISNEQNITSKARIEISGIKTISSKSRIEINSNQIINSKSRITNSNNQSLTSKARIQIFTNKLISSKGNIKATIRAGVGYALQFDGVQNYVSLGTMGNFGSNLGSGFYCKFDIKSTQTTLGTIFGIYNLEAKVGIELNNNSIGNSLLMIIRDDNGLIFRFNVNNNWNDGNIHIIEINVKPILNIATVLIDDVSQTVNINQTGSPSSFVNFNFNFDIGGRNLRNNNFINQPLSCTVDNFQIGTSSSNLYGSYNFSEGTGTTTADSSGQGNTGTLTKGAGNYPAWVMGFDQLTSKARITIASSKTLITKTRIEILNSQNILAKGRIVQTSSYSITSKSRIALITNQIITSKANIRATIIKTLTTIGRIKISNEKNIITKADIKQNYTQTITSKTRLEFASIQTIFIKANIICITKIELISPVSDSEELTPTMFVFKIPTCCKEENIHINIQIDKSSALFNDIEKDLYSFRDNDFEYWNGSSWVTYPIIGVSNLYYGNEARILITLTSGTKYWRVKGGVK